MATEPTQSPVDRMINRALDFKRRWPVCRSVEGVDVAVNASGRYVGIAVFGLNEVRNYSAYTVGPVKSSFESEGRLYQQLGDPELLLHFDGTTNKVHGYDVARVAEAIIGDNALPWAIRTAIEDARNPRGH